MSTSNRNRSFEERWPDAVERLKAGTFNPKAAETMREFIEKYPEYKEPEPIECLNLIMRRENAEDIVNGEKVIEFRTVSDFYCKRLIDPESHKFMAALPKEDRPKYWFGWSYLRPVRRIHFHNYNDTWTLDVKCEGVEVLNCNKSGLDWLHSFGCHEMDEFFEEYMRNPAKIRPQFFALVCGEIIERNNI